MSKRTFNFLFCSILLIAFLIRIIPTFNNNFFFTMDQGNDAVHVREIIYRHQLLLRGPETGLNGLFAGPLWYYFIGFGYAIFGGHPFGSVFMIILLNFFLTGIIMWKVKKEVSPSWALIIGAALQTSWWFYDTSRYGFNPFPLVFLSFWLIFALINSIKGNNHYYLVAAIPIGLGFNAEIAGSIAFGLFYLTFGLWLIIKKKITLQTLILGILIIAALVSPLLLSEVTTNFSQTHTFIKELHNPNGVFSEKSFPTITPKLIKIVSRSALRQIPEIGFFIFTFTLFLVFEKKEKKSRANLFVKHFVGLSLFLLIVSWLWFSSNNGWQDWQTVYISPLIFVSFILLLSQLKKQIAIPLLIFSLISHLLIFQQRYQEYWRPSGDASLLYNELKAVDWVYQKSEGKGFFVYNYLPSVLDYPYQYLFWWYGKNKYGYLPCEYASYSNAPKLFVPGEKYYREPKRECENLRFLIIEPDINQNVQNIWLNNIRQNTQLLEELQIGNIKVEKRLKI